MSGPPVLRPVVEVGTPQAYHLSRHLSPVERHMPHAVNELPPETRRRTTGTESRPRQERPSAARNARPTGHPGARRGRSCLGPSGEDVGAQPRYRVGGDPRSEESRSCH